jgi:hypothetical protein
VVVAITPSGAGSSGPVLLRVDESQECPSTLLSLAAVSVWDISSDRDGGMRLSPTLWVLLLGTAIVGVGSGGMKKRKEWQ